MRSFCFGSKVIRCLLVIIVLMLTVHLSRDAKAKTSGKDSKSIKINQASRESAKSERFVSIDFNNVDINLFIKFISELTAKNFVIDQRVKGKVTIISPSRISIKEAYRVFESVLEVHGYTTV